MSLLSLSGVRRHYGGVHAVDGVSLDVDAGEILGLIGPNGAGKTTLVNLVTGHATPQDGTITLDGSVALHGRPVHTIARHGIARTFQNIRLYRGLSVLDNIVAGAHLHRRFWAPSLSDARSLLARVGLDPAIGRRPATTLSYGDQRRVEIARALALAPRVLLLDEPAAGMNPVEKNRLADLLRSLVAETGLTIVLVEHDLRLVMGLCNRVAVMDFGAKIADGPPSAVAQDPAVVAAYLGRHGVDAPPSGRTSEGPALLSVAGLSVSYGAVHAVQGVDLTVHEGEVVTIIGANGAGKTTLLRTLSGLVRAREGRVRFGELDLRAAKPHHIVAAGLAHVPEGREILASLTVAENLALGGWRTDHPDVDTQYARFPILGERRHIAAGTLSGGEQQMLAIARALVARPRLLLLDEPSLGLAPQLADQMFALIRSLAEEGMTILLVEQNAAQALRLADRGYVLDGGRVVLSGPGAPLLDDPQVQAAYLGT